MEFTETIAFFQKQASRAESGISAADSSGNYQLFAFNSRQLFKSFLMRALMIWRQGRDPSDLIYDAVRSLDGAAIRLTEWKPDADLGEVLPLEKLAVLKFLMGGRPLVCRISGVPVDKELDCYLAEALLSGKISSHVPDCLHRIEREGGVVAARSYSSYFQLIGDDSAKAGEAPTIKEAGELFNNRARDRFFSNGDQTDGGGESNSMVVDYRLAAVLKKIGYVGPSIHSWRW